MTLLICVTPVLHECTADKFLGRMEFDEFEWSNHFGGWLGQEDEWALGTAGTLEHEHTGRWTVALHTFRRWRFPLFSTLHIPWPLGI